MKSVGERLDWFSKNRGMSLEELGQFLGYEKAKTAAKDFSEENLAWPSLEVQFLPVRFGFSSMEISR